MLVDFDMVGVQVHPSFATTVYRLISNSVSSSICMGSLCDHQGCRGIVGHYLCGFRLLH